MSLEGLISNLHSIGIEISIRQLQRDLLDIYPLIKETESIITSRNSERIKFYQIIKTRGFNSINNFDNIIKSTKFYEAKLNHNSASSVFNLIQVIKNNYFILIKKLSFDYTGDNNLFTQKNIQFKPIEILHHRGTHYIGGYNIGKKTIQFFEINQIKEYTILDQSINYPNLNEKLHYELGRRFGISKNINNEIYNIKLEFSYATGNFIRNHYWHNSQQFQIKKEKF